MEVLGAFDLRDEPVDYAAVRCVPGGGMRHVSDAVQRESCFSIVVDGKPFAEVGCSAGALVDLAVGRLFTDGAIEGAGDVARVFVNERDAAIEVGLAPAARERYAREGPRPLRPVRPSRWDAEWAFSMARTFAEDKTSHRRTRGVHSVHLSTRAGEVACCREDIGRHNAFDKAVGHALLAGVDLARCMAFLSGRVPLDMAEKAVRAGIPLVVSKAVATDRTVEFARACRLTLACSATPEGFDVLNDPGRFVTRRAVRTA